jgi:hypothetical protein
MFVRPSNADGSLRVHVPSPGDDRPSWGRVGVIAVIGFVVGVAWPRVAGVRLGPSVPDMAGPALSASAPAGAPSAPPGATPAASHPLVPLPPVPSALPTAPEPRPAEVPVTTSVPAPTATAEPSGSDVVAGPTVVSVGRGYVSSCRTPHGDSLKGAECGTAPGFDGLVVPRLRKLADCPAAAGMSGKLRLTVHAEFPRGTLSVELGHGPAPANAEALVDCARDNLRSVSLASLAHEQARYVVNYLASFGPRAESSAATNPPASWTGPPVLPAPASPPATAAANGADGIAQVAWDVALVRDAPKTGRVVARLRRGTAVRAGAADDGWVPVRYGDDFARLGWVYHGAIGL